MTRNDFANTYPTQPAGLDQQGRYKTRPHRATDQNFGALYERKPMDEVIRCHRNGQPIAGEAVAEPDDEQRQPGDGVLTVLMWVVAAVFAFVVIGHAIARWWA